MFWNLYPYTDFHEMNLTWCIDAILQLDKAMDDFVAGNKLTLADPIRHDLSRSYAKNTIVVDENGNAYISLKAVPVGVDLGNSTYWLEVFNYEGFTEKANKNFTDNYFRNVTRSPEALLVGDWVVLDDVLYKVTADIAVDDLFEIDTNIVHFTVEEFLKEFVQEVENTLSDYSLTIQQYKDDIDASELAYRNQLAQDIANTTASLQAQLDAAISGVTVDSEVINARVGADGITYDTLGDAIRGQVGDLQAENDLDSGNTIINLDKGHAITCNQAVGSAVDYQTLTDYPTMGCAVVDCNPGDKFTIRGTGGSSPRLWAFIDSDDLMLSKANANATATNLEITAPDDAAKCIINTTGVAFKGQTVNNRITANTNDISQLQSEMLDRIVETRNTADGNENDYMSGGYSNADGSYYSNSTLICTKEYLPESVVNVEAKTDAQFRVVAYDSDDAYVGMLNGIQTAFSISASWHTNVDITRLRRLFPGYKYMIVAHDVGAGTISPSYASNLIISYSVIGILDDTNQLIFETIASPASDYIRASIDASDGSYTSSTNRISSADYINDNVKRIVATGDAEFRVIAYDNNVFQGMLNVAETEIGTSTSFHTDVDMEYLRRKYPDYKYKITVRDTSDDDITTNYAGNVKYHIDIYYHLDELQDQIDALKGGKDLSGKLFAGLGDSIMYGASPILGNHGYFIEYIANLFGANYVNYSRAGARIGSHAHSYDVWNQVDNLVASAYTPDYILFNGYINDVAISGDPNTPLGEVTAGFDPDDFNVDTFAGAFEYILYNLKDNYPNAKIIYITTHNAGSRVYDQQVEYRDMALQICLKYSVRVADVYRLSDMNTNMTVDRNAFTRVTTPGNPADGTHPNFSGYTKKYLPVIVEQIVNA